jgi:hypothetical protein
MIQKRIQDCFGGGDNVTGVLESIISVNLGKLKSKNGII